MRGSEFNEDEDIDYDIHSIKKQKVPDIKIPDIIIEEEPE